MQIITVNYGIINCIGALAKFSLYCNTILHFGVPAPYLFAELRQVFTPDLARTGGTASIDGSRKQPENGPLHKQKTLQYGAISD